MMGGVNQAPNYVSTVDIGFTTTDSNGVVTATVTNSLLQGVIVAVYCEYGVLSNCEMWL